MEEIPKGRQPKSHLAIRPGLAEEFRNIARRRRLQLSDLFHEMFSSWLKREGRQWADEVDLNDDE